MKNRPLLWLLGLVLGVGGLMPWTGCSDSRSYLRDVGTTIDPVAKGLEEYGTISVSSPLLTTPPEYFEFKLERTPKDYYDDAAELVQGGAALSIQQAIDFQGALRLRADIDVMLRDLSALHAYRDDVSRFNRARTLGELSSAIGALGTFADLQKSLTDKELGELLAQEQEKKEREDQGLPEPAPEPSDVVNKRNELANLSKLSSQIAALNAWVGTYQAAQGAPTSRPSFPQTGGPAPDIDPNLLPQVRPAQEVLRGETFTAPIGLLGDLDQTLSSRTKLMISDGDYKTQCLLRFLSNPTLAAKFKDKVVLFGVSMVSVAPGNRTYRGYAGEVAVTVDFDFVPQPEQKVDAREAGRKPIQPLTELPPAPLVAAVSPMTESQTLDLKASIREQRALALRLALALQGLGAKAEAEAFLDYVKRLEQDVATRNAANYVTSFSHSGGVFGYHIAPRLTALSNPASKEARSDMLLERQSFPVLIVIGIDRDDLAYFKRVLPCGCEQILRPALKFRQTTRWLPLGNPIQDGKPFGRFFDQLSKPSLSERERMDWMARVAKAYEIVNGTSAIKHVCHRQGKLIVLGDFEQGDQVNATSDCIRVDTLDGDGVHASFGWAQFTCSPPQAGQIISIQHQRKPKSGLSPETCRWEHYYAIPEDQGRFVFAAASDGVQDVSRGFARNRIQILDYSGLDSWSYQNIPLELFEPDKEQPFKTPSISEVIPGHMIAGGNNQIVLLGRNLNVLDKDSIRSLGVDLKLTIKEQNAHSILLAVETDPRSAGFSYFTGSFVDSERKKVRLISPPVRVTPITRSPREITIARDGKQGKDALRFPSDAPLTIVERFAEPPPATRPAQTDANVEVKVNVEDSGNTK